MSYVNEYASDEDVVDYKLKELLFDFNPHLKKLVLLADYRFAWTVDKRKKSFLFKILEGREEFRGLYTWIFKLDNSNYAVETKLCEGGSNSLRDDPYVRIWRINSVSELISKKSETSDMVISHLKEALNVYGFDGVRHQADNAIVKFV